MLVFLYKWRRVHVLPLEGWYSTVCKLLFSLEGLLNIKKTGFGRLPLPDSVPALLGFTSTQSTFALLSCSLELPNISP